MRWFFDWLYRVVELLVRREEPWLKGGCSLQFALFLAAVAGLFFLVRWLS